MNTKPNNPYKQGSFYHQQANTYYGWYSVQSLVDLCKELAILRNQAKDYCQYGWKTMSNMDFQADCIEQVILANIES